MADNRLVGLRKLIPGSMSILLTNIQLDRKKFYAWRSAGVSKDIIRVPIEIAATIFIEDGTKKDYDEGRFEIIQKDKEAVLEKAKELGFYYDELEEEEVKSGPSINNRYTAQQIEEFLLTQNKDKVEQILKDRRPVQMKILTTYARKYAKDLSRSILIMIQEATGGVYLIEGE